ncbi:DUF4422 domain-containing protein [Enterobacter cloacae complex sp. I2]|uniref:DUF4422 domain-containing protein n=1 Tax=Enterobacter cloacae complex sp. I2 TaxID=2779603 RepID=UPI0018674259|nr:DUF4422 domain-containing protein [Enterobacter cloacae complex sp. I2]EKS7429260.1 DUF4422 domain-containing protein [Enterobacter cancerogenus]MBE3513131.1 DUF4422 domain-containing protein [Enterobacter cloacae complex sp. I2]
MNIKILVCHHKAYPFVKNECFLPVHVGKSISTTSLEYAIPDNTGDNISRKNASWCELTALYWAWKNLDADYYGLMHYRRLLNFNAEGNGCYHFNEITQKQINDFGWTPEVVKETCARYDIITSPVWNIHPAGLPKKVMNARDFYGREHDARALDTVTAIVKERYPDYYLPLLQSLSESACTWGNIAVMKSLFFYEYCEFLFGVLEEAEKRIDISDYDAYQRRVFGFLAERLLNCYLVYAQGVYPGLKVGSLALAYGVTEKPVLHNLHPDATPATYKTDRVKLCMSFDDNYAPHADAAITSLVSNSATGQEIDIYVICDARLSAANREKIGSVQATAPWVSVHFLEVDASILQGLPLNRKYISRNTYYRLLMQRLLPAEVEKIIYLDSDVIVCGNIAELWDAGMEGYCIAGVYDEGGILQARRLHPFSSTDYINAGVVIFNFREINRRFPDMFLSCSENYYLHKDLITLQDQDILNITFSDSISTLALRWNVSSRMFTFNDLEHVYTQAMVGEAVNAPGIVHFTDSKKPWGMFCDHPLRHLYWHYREAGHYGALSLRERLTRRCQGYLQYRVTGSAVVCRIFNAEVRLPIKKIAILLRFIRLFR